MTTLRIIRRLRELHRLLEKLSTMQMTLEAEYDGTERREKLVHTASFAEYRVECLQKKLQAPLR